eukprot:Tbor_TRINITY_DN3373_c0_g1::TRINITY_DN3373_c0_g1_i1::g.23530::m.23530/K12180/COPS7, CSN7; COP9 signalosome complex subunit 7
MSAFVCTARELDPVKQSTATVASITESIQLVLSNPNIYFYGNLYNEPNLKILLDSKKSTPETKSLFALVEILAFGQSSDLQRLQRDPALCERLGISPPCISKGTGIIRKLQYLTLLSLFSNAIHGNQRKVSYTDIAVAVGDEALEIDRVSPNIRYVEDLVLDMMAAEIATCRINHVDKYIEVVKFEVRDIPPVDSDLKFVKLEHSGKEQIAAILGKIDQWLSNCVDVCNNAGSVDIAVKNRQDYIAHRAKIASIVETKHIQEGIMEEKALVNDVEYAIQHYKNKHRDYHY